jgi:SAM-dependent methyltransferase/acyl carrier protein
MSNVGSYEISTFSTGVAAEIKRLNAQIDLFWPKECALYRSWGVGSNMEIIDFGCGTGYLIEKLLNEYPSSKFTGVEQDPHLASIARENLEKYHNVEQIFEGSILSFSSQKKFDVATMRLVLEHVLDPHSTLVHIRSLLKPDGRIIIIDNDFDYHLRTYPEISELDALYKAYCASRVHDKGDPCIGRRLPALLKAAGFSSIDLEIISSHNQLIGDSVFLTAEGAGIPAQLVKSGYLNEQVMNALIAKWKDMLYSPDHVMFRQLFAATATASESTVPQAETMYNTIKATPLGTQQVYENSSDYIGALKSLIVGALNTETEGIDDTLSLINIGLDSIGASDMQQCILQIYGVEVTMSELLGGATIKEVASIIEQKVAHRSSQSSNSSQLRNLPISESGAV